MHHNFNNREVLPNLLRILLFIILFCYGLIIPFLLLLLFILRKIVQLTAKLLRPDLKTFVRSASVIFAQEDILQKPKFNEVVTFISDGHVTLEDFRSIFHQRLLLKRKEPKGELYYPELRRYWISYLTYLFWKEDEEFDLRNHVRIYDYGKEEQQQQNSSKDGETESNIGSDTEADPESEPDLFIPQTGFCNENDLRRVMSSLLEKPWVQGRSPWEMLLIQNFKSIEIPIEKEVDENSKGTTIVIFRFHHALADGYSISKLLLRDLMQNEPKTKINFPKMTVCEKIRFSLILPLKLPWDLAGNMITGFDGTNSWHGWGRKHKYSRKFYTSISPPVDTQIIKDIKNKYGVGYNAVLCAAVAGGCQRVMEEVGQVVPKKMTCVVPVPLPNHPNGLVNHVTIHFMKWPMAKCTREERLRQISHEMLPSKFYAGPLGYYLLTKIGMLAPFISKLRCFIPCTVMLSSFPGPEKQPTFDGLGVNLVDIIGGLTPGSGSVGTSMLLISSNGRQRFTASIDKKIFPSEKVFVKLGQYIEEELMLLYNAQEPHTLVEI